MMVQFELTAPWRVLPAGPLLLRGALPAALCVHWLARAGAPTATSRRAATVLDGAAVLQALADSPLRAPIEAALGPAPLCNLDQSWLRHGRPAHHWHQDGALGFDFIAHAGQPAPADALLPMLTCWIALTPCGHDAPGLEWVAEATPQLLWPHELVADAVDSRHPPDTRLRPVLQPGDALLFDGSLLHRTHLTPAMPNSRSSLELRFFAAGAWPARLATESRQPLPPARAAADPDACGQSGWRRGQPCG